MKNLLTIILSLFIVAAGAQPLSISAYKAKVNTQVRTSTGPLSITKEKIATLYDDLADIVEQKVDADTLEYYVTGDALDDSLEVVRAEFSEISTIEPGTTTQIWQGDKTWIEKAGLPISTATQTALNTKFTNGGNSFAAAAIWGTNDANYAAIEVNGTEALRVHAATGNTSFGNTTDAGYKVNVTGAIQLSDILYFNNTSVRIQGTAGSGNVATGVGITTGAGATRSTQAGNSLSMAGNAQRCTQTGNSNTITGNPTGGTQNGNFNVFTSGDNYFTQSGSSHIINYTGNGISIGTYVAGFQNYVLHKYSNVIGSNQTTTADGQLILAVDYTNSPVSTSGHKTVYLGGTGPRAVNTDLRGSDVTWTGSGPGIGTDKLGGKITIAGTPSTGAATPQDVVISTCTAGSSGTSLQTATDRLTVKGGTGYIMLHVVPLVTTYDSVLVLEDGIVKSVIQKLTATASLDFPSTASNSQADLTIALTGAVLGDVVAIGEPVGSVGQGTFTGFVSATDTVTIRFHNTDSGVYDPASGNFKVFVFK